MPNARIRAAIPNKVVNSCPGKRWSSAVQFAVTRRTLPYKIQVVLARKLPVQLTGERRVRAQAEVLVEIDRVARPGVLKRPAGVRVEREAVNAHLVRVEAAVCLAIQRGRNHSQERQSD